MARSTTKKRGRRCGWCGVAENVDEFGYSNMAPYLGYCLECIVKADRLMREEEARDRRGVGAGEDGTG
jgi:hypothetical protein